MLERVGLDVAPDPERRRVRAHERRVPLVPVALELLAREMRQPAEAEDELDHVGIPGFVSPSTAEGDGFRSSRMSSIRVRTYAFHSGCGST